MPDEAGRGTILHRVAAALRRQDWTAVALEFVIVFVGVLLGTQVSNWNDERREAREVRRLLDRLTPDLRQGLADGPYLARYYQSRIDLGRKAERLLMEGGDDLDLVTSARLTGSYAWVVDFDRDTYAMKIGEGTVPEIESPQLREALATLIRAQNDEYVRYRYIDSEFRRAILRIYPSDAAKAIADACNTVPDDAPDAVVLARISNTECKVDLAPDVVRGLAAELRARPELLDLLREHINRLGVMQGRVAGFASANRDVLVAMGEQPAAPTDTAR